ncbi:MAG TPA: DUF6074 family protein [Pseudorhizobium sp.]|nr:DUF6074 family protein [Pseudorhizobium sp.]
MLVQFPLHRRTADIRRCAETLRELNGEDANRFWRDEMTRFAGALRRIGTKEEEIGQQARIFMDAVQIELQSFFADEAAG